MSHRLALCSVLLAGGLAACTTQHTNDSARPEASAGSKAPAATATAPATGTAATTAAGTAAPGLTAQALAARQEAAAKAAQAAMQASLQQRLVHFDYDQSSLHADDIPVLKAHAAWLIAHPQARVRLAGHTDERGTAEYNMALGERRAKAVQAFLAVQGVKPAQMDVVSFGREKPVDPGHDESAWARNRRVEIVYLNTAP